MLLCSTLKQPDANNQMRGRSRSTCTRMVLNGIFPSGDWPMHPAAYTSYHHAHPTPFHKVCTTASLTFAWCTESENTILFIFQHSLFLFVLVECKLEKSEDMVLSYDVQLIPTDKPSEEDKQRAIFWDYEQGIYFAYTKRQAFNSHPFMLLEHLKPFFFKKKTYDW